MAATMGDYTLGAKLGEGGMAEVYMAHLSGPVGFSKRVAIKMMHQKLMDVPDSKALFAQEARLAAKLDHANIVRVERFGEQDGKFFLVMEYVDGISLFEAWKFRSGILPVPLVLTIIAGVCRGLEYAHGQSGEDPIIHRDIKHQNILLARSGDVKIADFGLAKLIGAQGNTRTGMIRGTLGYISPEQALGKDLDGQSDLFSLGVVLWELLTGQRLFAGTGEERLARVVSAEIQPPSYLSGQEIDPQLDELVLRSLARDKSARLDSAKSLRKGLELALERYHSSEKGVEAISSLVTEALASRPKTEETVAEGSQNETKVANDQDRQRRPWLPWALSSVAALLFAATLVVLSHAINSDPESPAPAKHSSPVVQPEPKTDVRDGPQQPKKEVSSVGYLSLNTTKWAADVFIGQKRLGETPLYRLKLEPGKYRLRLKNKMRTKFVDVEIQAGKQTRRTVRM
jgi:serine/threonine protein kinase